MGLLLFDCDGDADLDLYRVRGSYEFAPESDELQDELWKNDGKGNFSRESNALPKVMSAGSCVRAADIDKDGDLDLFVGGQVVPGAYPLAAESFILRNDGVSFSDVSEEWFPNGKALGLIQDALWTDVDADGHIDLLLAGRWMAPTWYRNTGNGFEDRTEASGLAAYQGWWNSLAGADFDRDGDIDYIAGNWGLNSSYCATQEEPMEVYAKDFDGNGSVDAIIGCYFDEADGGRGPYAIHTRMDLIKQLNIMRGRFPTFAEYGSQPFSELLTPEEKQEAFHAKATHLVTSYLENKGDGTFAVHALPLP
ncbi:MAG: VCBS repeat-containing protein, partial [Bacteroidota bacterium]